MIKLRKILALLFAILTIIMAVLAYKKKFSPRSEKIQNISQCQWSDKLEKIANKSNKLILFTTTSKLDKSKLSPQAQDVLERFYIHTQLSPERFPADYEILKKIFELSTHNKEEICIGVLSPKMRPIFLASKLRYDSNKNSINNILQAAANIHVNTTNKMQERANATSKIFDITPLSMSSFGDMPINIEFYADIHTWNMFVFFNSQRKIHTAHLSENARLATIISERFPHLIFAQRASNLAVSRMLFELSNAENLSNSQKLTMLRAIAEISNFDRYQTMRANCKKSAIDILKYQNARGLFEFEKDKISISENALALSFLAKSAKFSKSTEIEESAKRCAKALIEILDAKAEMPAITSETEIAKARGFASQATSREYAYTCSALADMHKLTRNPNYIYALSRAVEEWERFYMTDRGLFSLNSRYSPMGAFLRPIFIDDNHLPSYIGEVAQVALYAKKYCHKNFSFTDKLDEISKLAFRQAPYGNALYASLKLATLQ